MKIVTAAKVLFYFIKSYRGSRKAIFLSPDETIETILQNRISLIRYGDGEMNYIEGENVHYQKKDNQLQIYLKKIVDEYIERGTNTGYLVAMPENFLACKGKSLLKNKSYFISWSYARNVFNNKYDVPVEYGDAFLFALENTKKFQRIWKEVSVDNIVLVHNDECYLEQLKNECEKDCFFIKIPQRDAFSDFNEILTQILSLVGTLKKENTMVLISAGPCAKALIYELSKVEVWAIDTGHCFCKPLHVMR